MSIRKLRYLMLLTIIFAIGIFIYERNLILDYALRNKSVSKSQLIRFSKTFQKQYVSLVEHTISEPYRMYFQFYSERPYEIKIIKSNSKGAALTFVPSKTPKFSYQTTDLEIESAIFPSRELSEESLSKKILESVFSCDSSYPRIVVKARDCTIELIEFVTTGKKWIEIIGEGTVSTRNIVVNKVFYPNLIKMKASTLRKSWSGNEAKREAEELFGWEFWPALEASEDFREYMAYPELEEIAIHILENWRKNPDYTMFDLKKDFEKLYFTAILKYNVRSDFAKDIYNFLTVRYTLRKKLLGIEYADNWIYTAISSIVLVLISSLLVSFNFIFRVYRGAGFRPLLKKLKKRVNYLFPIGVCWLLFQQRPTNASFLQWLVPWVITCICVYIIYRVEMKFCNFNSVS
jgi:hypothetical protein